MARRGHRSNYGEICQLVIEGARYRCILDNLSVCGALLKCGSSLPPISSGVECKVRLCDDPAVCQKEYTCQIVRVSSSEVGVCFLNMPRKTPCDESLCIVRQ